MPIGPARMPILEHLGELRRRLIIIVVSLAIAAGILYFLPVPTAPGAFSLSFSPFHIAYDPTKWQALSLSIIEFLTAPVRPFMGDASLSYFNALGAFNIRFRVALYGAIVVASPIILWQIFAFFLPALKPKERKWIVPTVLAAIVLFVIGNVFCYLVIVPTAYEWMFDQAGNVMTLVPNVEVLISSITLFLLGFGVAFELPLIVFYLVTFDIIKYEKLRQSWRIIYLGLLIVSAVATPDASPVTMFLMFIALVVLYEISLLLAYIVSGKRREKKRREELVDDEDEDDDAWNA